MSERDILIIFHYDGNFEFDMMRPVYNGGKQKMRYLSTNITYGSLVVEAIEASNWDASTESLSIQYLHHNGRAFSLASIEDDNDVKRMMKASGRDTNGIYLYVSNNSNSGEYRGGEQSRFQRIDKHRSFHGNSRNKLTLNCKGKEVNDMTAIPELPTVDLEEDNDMHFSTVRNITSPLYDCRQEIDVDNIEDGADYCDENYSEENNFTGQIPVVVMGADIGNIARGNPYNNACVKNIEDGVECGDENCFDTNYLVGQVPVIVMSSNRGGVANANPEENACVDNEEDGAEYVDENHFGLNNLTCQIPVIVVGPDRSNVATANPNKTPCPSSEHSGINLVDNMVPEHMNTDVGNNSAREMWIGREFPDRDTFRRTLATFAIYGNFTLKHLRTNSYKVTACCKDQGCPWRIHASIVESGPQFKVRTYNAVHTCSKPMMGMAHKQVSALLIAEFIMEMVRQNANLKTKEIMHEYQMEFGTTITYRKAQVAKEIALRAVRGSYEESFQMPPIYCIELQRTNPGTVTNIETTSDDRFRRFFWAFGVCIKSFINTCRPVLAVDGTHLRGKYPRVLLVAVTHDANHKLLPIAFAFAEAERRDSWQWFLANLHIALGEPNNLTIVSDGQKGLIPALLNTIPSAKHFFCCRHIAENIRVAFSDATIVMKFWRAAKANRPCEYDAYMNDIRTVNQEAFKYIDAIGRQQWADAYVDGRRYEMLTSNAAECTNAILKDTRVQPITRQVEEIRSKLMEFYQKRRLESQAFTSRLTPYVETILERETEEAQRLHVRVAGLIEFQVQSAEYVDIVDLERKTCTCRKWDILGIPCAHVLASMRVRNYDLYEFCEHWYLSSLYRTTYSEVLHATRDNKQWEHTSDVRVLPPRATKQPGRPKKNRIRTEDRGRQRRVVTCGNCKIRGHNRQSCRNPPVQT